VAATGDSGMTALTCLRTDDVWSLEHLVDELASQLAIYDDYYNQARSLIYKIPIADPPQTFKIKLSHLSDRINKELYQCKKRGLTYVLKEAAGRVFENVDYKYFHQSVKHRLDVELVE
jgi:hypothetical protein